MKKLLLIGVTVILVLCFSDKNLIQAESSTINISKEDALKITENYILKYQNSYDRNTEVILKNYLYDIDDTILGYHFELYNLDNYQGYIVISATTDRDPVLESGAGLFMEEQPKANEKIYYLGAFSYIFAEDINHLHKVFQSAKEDYIKELEREFSTMNNSDFISGINDLQNEIEEVNKMNLESLNRLPGEFEKEWKDILTPNKVNLSSYKRLPVTRVYQRVSGVTKPTKACGPAVAVMINNYYKGKGYWVKDSTDYGGHANYINRMIKEMNTGTLGTSAANFRDGLRRQLNVNHKTSTSPWRAWTLSGNGYFESYKTSISGNRPVALRFDNIIKGSKFTKYHFVAGIGYDGTEAIVKDPDNGKTNTGDRRFSWKTNQSVITMIINSPN
ncbi:C39 family peptidase [Ornithinibacillus scapharcae]|uniref:C39 family peptidase n=1 Tax=Ornithinibacillus scapharcae TaxID=1147159 RepID=UPI000225B604|nr:C39 family peptidase [Ornithinibacillus scapharcae]